MERFTVKISPNREIRISQSLACKRGGGRSVDQSLPNIQPGVEQEVSNPGQTAAPLLDISSEFQRDKPTVKSGWGRLPKESRFGLEQKRGMLRAGAVCDRQYGLRQVVLTGTLPGNTNEANYALAVWSGYVMNRVLQWVRRIVGENWAFGVWEYQKRGALHVHLAVCYETEEQCAAMVAGWKDQWVKVLRDVSVKEGIDLFDTGEGYSHQADVSVVQADAKKLRKSCAAYFSKYASKSYGQCVAAEMKKGGLFRFCPSRWIVLSRAVSRAIREQTFCYEIDGRRETIDGLVEEWLHNLEQLDCLRFAYKHKVIAGKTYVFYFEDEEFREASEQVHSAFKSKVVADETKNESQAKCVMRPLPRGLPKILRRSANQLPKRHDRLVYRWSANTYWSKGISIPLAASLWSGQFHLIPPHYLRF